MRVNSIYPPTEAIALRPSWLSERVATVRDVTVPWVFDRLEEMGVVRNFRRAAGREAGDHEGLENSDEFLYKAIEAGSYALELGADAGLSARMAAIAGEIAAAQEPDGYLRTPHSIYWLRGGATPRAERWSKLNGDLELYCLGHLFEGAVAHHVATGETVLLDVARRAADLVERRFGPNADGRGVDMIPEIELALVRLAEATSEERYLDLAAHLVGQRGRGPAEVRMGSFSLDHVPLEDQTEAVGHATFAAYLYSAALDIARNGRRPDLVAAVQRLWEDAVHRKMNVIGGFGSRHDIEGFSDAFDLPNLTAYNEICAAVGFCGLNTRLFAAERHARAFDVLERTLYNNLLAGVGLDGRSFFYVCPSESDGSYAFNMGWLPDHYRGPYADRAATRKPWIPCACCPPTLARWLLQVPRHLYAVDGLDLWANLYASSDAFLAVGGVAVRIAQRTEYPWDGDIELTLDPARPVRFRLHLRVPAWTGDSPISGDLYAFADDGSKSPTVHLNGEAATLTHEAGYAVLDRTWQPGDRVRLHLPMPVRRIVARAEVTENARRVAVQRGPILFAFEGHDHPEGRAPRNLADATPLQFHRLGGPLTDVPWLEAGESRGIPYYAWSNRGPTEMRIWLTRT